MSRLHEVNMTGKVQGTLVIPERRSDFGVVVAGGSSGRVDVGRAKLFASHGAVGLALRWFGGDGQAPGICEVPLETFTEAADELVALGCKRLAFVGTSKGAEAGLLTAVHDFRFDVVVAISPTSVVWGNVGSGRDGEVWPGDALWPSDTFAKSIASRLTAFGRHSRLLLNQEAGHRVLLPGEMTPRSTIHAHGGHDEADAALGRDAWNVVTEVLGLL